MKSIANLILTTILLSCFVLTTTIAQSYGEHIRIENRWKSDIRIHLEHGKLEATKVKDGAWSAMWIINRTADGQYVTIKNRWKSNLYLVASQQGPVEYEVKGTESYAQWKLEKASDGNFYKIISRHFPNHFLHIEYGTLQLSGGDGGWHSAQWAFNPVSSANNKKKNTYASVPTTTVKQQKLDYYQVKVIGIKCISVDSGEPGSSNEFYGNVEVGSSDRNILPNVVWQRGESNPQEVQAGRSISINDQSFSTYMSADNRNDYLYVKATIKEDDGISADDDLGTKTKKIALGNIREGLNEYRFTGFRKDGDVVEINFEITKKSKAEAPNESKKKGSKKVSPYNTPVYKMYFRYTDQVVSRGDMNLKVGSKVYVLPSQTVKHSAGISFDPNNPKVCGKTFTVKSLDPLKFTQPFPEKMRNTNNSSFTFKVQKIN